MKKLLKAVTAVILLPSILICYAVITVYLLVGMLFGGHWHNPQKVLEWIWK